ncbi:RHS repeat-associated core domain-containing protein [Burkholderia sola]|uniref:RHS repeat-associated core domain-containing protein n=1 Tax=Burkholderia TaxID=32008 RepID=UPI001AE6E07D|nr:RHS repeat-associated core domain-containing protein [Burkholderia sp. AcTa6-5]MBP0714258.1 RHS repeat protein [Burkholderia sp. AcTa6-5]
MSGKPAARISDSVKGGKIITGSRTVLIGSQGGIACSVCPGGVKVGSPVNPQLGAKVLSGAADLDFALPGAMPLVWQRQYSSYVNASEGGHCGILGYGWGTSLELRLTVLPDATLLHDSQGRTITFEALPVGESIHSPSEDIWLLRTGMHPGGLAQELASLSGAARFAGETANEPEASEPATAGIQAPAWWSGRFAWVRRDLACSAHLILAASGKGDQIWIFAPVNWQAIETARKALHAQPGQQAPSAEALPAPSEHWVLLGTLDRLGRSQRYRWTDSDGPQRITTIEDGVGRQYQLHYAQAHAARQARHYASGHFWQADSGLRLSGIDLVSDPIHPLLNQGTKAAKPLTLVSYAYSAEGDLIAVTNRHGEVVRRFGWRNHLMVFHQERDGPEHHYAYDRDEPGGKVIEQRNQQGLDYRFDYRTLPELEGQPRTATVVSDSLGRQQAYLFQGESGLARLVEHTRADGSTVRRSYNPYGHLSGITDPLGRTTYLRISPEGELFGVQNHDGSTSSQNHDANTGLLQSATDAAGRTIRYHYDHHHRLTRITGPDGSEESLEYPEPTLDRLNADKPIRITDASGGSKRLAYTPAGQLASYTDCSDYTTHYEYNRWGQPAAETNAQGERTSYQYNDRGQLLAVHHPDESIERYQYDAQGRVSQVQAGRHNSAAPSTTAASVSMEYDLWGRLTHRSHAGHSLAFAYDAAGRLAQLTNENGEHTHFAWDAMDRLTQETGFDARVQSYQYDAAGQLSQSSDGWAGDQGQPEHTTRYEWDTAGRLAARHLPATGEAPATIHRYQWSPAGELEQASVWNADTGLEWLQSQALIERDSMGRVTSEVQRLFQSPRPNIGPLKPDPVIEFEHRINHRLDALGNREASQLQGLGEVGYLLYGSGHVHGLMWEGNTLVDFERDALHRETKRLWSQDIGTAGMQPPAQQFTRQLEWDEAGRLRAMRLAGLPAAMPADMLDAPIQAARHVRPPQALVGMLTSRHYHYDSLGQMVGIETPAGTSRFAYDAAGRLTEAQGAQGTRQQWCFDAAGNRLPIIAGKAPGAATEPTGQLTTIDRQRAQQRAHDQARFTTPGEPHQAQPHWMEPHYNVLHGADTPEEQPGSAALYWAGNRIGNYSNSEDPGGGGAQLHYRYDSRGNRTESVDATTGRRMVLAYDAANQLTEIYIEEGDSQRRQCYRYDAFGRRLAKYSRDNGSDSGSIGRTDYYGWDGDRLVHIERHSAGNAQPELIHTVYEPGHFTPLLQLRRPAAAEKAAATLVEEIMGHIAHPMVRDALEPMLRDLAATQKQIMGNAERYMAQDARELMVSQFALLQQDQDEGRALRAKHIEVRHYLCDHLGTPQALISQQGEVEWAAALDAWGNLQQEYNPKKLHQPIRLPGQHEDGDTGLYYNRYRYYDPKLGQYANQDPIGLYGGLNGYRYAISNPAIKIDPLGLFTAGKDGVIGVDSDGIPSFDEGNSLFHSYNVTNSCSKINKGCTLNNAKEGLLKYPAPGASGQPIKDGQEGFAIPVGPVRHVVKNNGEMVVNITKPGHLLYPGIVRRWVTDDGNSVTIHTYGEGTGYFPKINEMASKPLWNSVDSNIFEYMGCEKQ